MQSRVLANRRTHVTALPMRAKRKRKKSKQGMVYYRFFSLQLVIKHYLSPVGSRLELGSLATLFLVR